MKLENRDLANVVGGAITASFLTAVLNIGKAIFDIGCQIGKNIRKYKGKIRRQDETAPEFQHEAVGPPAVRPADLGHALTQGNAGPKGYGAHIMPRGPQAVGKEISVVQDIHGQSIAASPVQGQGWGGM